MGFETISDSLLNYYNDKFIKKLENVEYKGELISDIYVLSTSPNIDEKLTDSYLEFKKEYGTSEIEIFIDCCILAGIQIGLNEAKRRNEKGMKPLEELEKELSNLDSILEQESERYDNVRIERKKIKIEIETRRLTSMVVDSFVKTKTDDKTTVYLKITKVDPDEDEGTAFIYGYGFYKNNFIIKGFRYESDELESITESEFYNEFEIVKKEINKIIKF